MGPLSDSDSDMQEFDACRKKALAAAARRQGSFAQSFQAKETSRPSVKKTQLPPPTRTTGRQLWADIATDDEDGFPRWHSPKQSAEVMKPLPLPTPVPATMDDEGLSWDPIGLGSLETCVADLLWNKMNVNKPDTSASSPGYDKWSWSTTATSADADVQDEDLSPSSQSQAPLSISSEESTAQIGVLSSTDESETHKSVPMPTMMQEPLKEAGQRTPAALVMPVPQVQQTVMVAVPAMHAAVPALPGVAALAGVPPMPCMPFGMGMLPYIMSSSHGLPTGFQHGPPRQANAQRSWENEEVVRPAVMPCPGFGGPPVGRSHRFHQKNVTMGVMSDDARTFTKRYNKGRLSIVCENKVHFQGTVRYAVQFTDGELCSADGVGFILSSDIPCTKNIQKIVSIFANRTGRICIRVHDEVERCPQRVKCLEVGDWLEVHADLTQQIVNFTVWPKDGSEPSFTTVSFKETLNQVGRIGSG
ncbi:unnamed protein product [Symbiodinium natans]|uniref:Uncharacterized protein n=1 Tax=Symbiodinium natans TaxID=878477 RepID=A0A812Q0K3_9DINO|nr:unnamed protein product [Symbiodinium natans]